MTLALTLPHLIIVETISIILFAYIIFGLTGFGSSITAMPFLALLYPLHFAVPLMLLLDLTASLLLSSRNYRSVDVAELVRLGSFTMAGIVLGVIFFIYLPSEKLQLALGIFVFASAMRGLFFPADSSKPIAQSWSAPMGIAGGAATAMFGTGGPLYAAYLTRRIQEKTALRATMGALISMSGLARLVMFAASGFLAQQNLILLAAISLPCMFLGLYAGNHLHFRLPGKQIILIVWMTLAFGGACLIWKNLGL